MKPVSIVSLLALLQIASSLAPCKNHPYFGTSFTIPSSSTSSSLLSMMSNVITGPTGRPASTKEEDLELTLKVILKHEDLLDDEPYMVEQTMYPKLLNADNNNEDTRMSKLFGLTQPIGQANLPLMPSIASTQMSSSPSEMKIVASNLPTNTLDTANTMTTTSNYDNAVKRGYEESEQSYQEYKQKFEYNAQLQQEYYRQNGIPVVVHVHEHLHRHVHEHHHHHDHVHNKKKN